MRVWPWVVAASVVVVARLVVADAQLDWDEELYWQVASAWKNGGVPYVDVIDHKPALVYALQLLYSGFSGNIWLLRLTATLVLAGSAVCFGWAFWPERKDLWAMLAFLVLLTLSAFGCVGANSEILYAPYILFTGAFLLRGALVPAALAAAVAFNVKYTVGLDILGVAAFAYFARDLSRARVAQFLVMAGVAAGLLWFGLYAYFRARGVDLIETTITANLMHASGQRKPFFEALGTYAVTRFLIVASALGLWAYFSGRRIEPRVRTGLLIWAAAALLQATITGKTFYHYFIPVYLPLCVLVVARWEHQAQPRWRAAGLAVAAALALTLLGNSVVRQRAYAEARDRLEADICDELQGREVYVADRLLATYRVCDVEPSKYMFPPFLFNPHFVRLTGSRGLDELDAFERVGVAEDGPYEEQVLELRDSGVVEIPSWGD